MWDESDGAAMLRRYNSFNLAWWHTFKYACLKVWKMFKDEVWAPLWHHLYPGHRFFEKPGSLPCVITHLLQVQLAYPAIQPQLQALLDMDLPPNARTMARDLSYLLGTALPVVP